MKASSDATVSELKRQMLADALLDYPPPFSFNAVPRGVYARNGNVIWVRFR